MRRGGHGWCSRILPPSPTAEDIGRGGAPPGPRTPGVHGTLALTVALAPTHALALGLALTLVGDTLFTLMR